LLNSRHPVDELVTRLGTALDPLLSRRRFTGVQRGPAGMTWRRDLSSRWVAAAVVLAVVGLAGLASGTAGTIVFGLLCWVAASTITVLRRPCTVRVTFIRRSGGVAVHLHGGGQSQVADIARAAVR
jgi:hypothetical protein